MTGLTQEMLDDDALADWCEAYGPSPDSETPVAEHFLRCAVEDGDDEQQLAEPVAAARSDGASWLRVAEILGDRRSGVQISPARQITPKVRAHF